MVGMVRGETTSCQDFAASVPATRGLIAAPWTPASLKLYSGGWSSGNANRAVGDSHKTGLQDST